MLKPLSRDNGIPNTEVAVSRAEFPVPVPSGLEFNAPVRGPWNIVNTGMLIPDSRQIFICAQGCLRGVILTAAEMNAIDRMSWVSVCENDFFNGELESGIVEGVSAILRKLRVPPRAVLVFISCIHQFAGCDFEAVLETLRARFPSIRFTDCYMNPTMRKSGPSPDQLMRRQLYSFLEENAEDRASVNLIGNNLKTDGTSDLARMIRSAGFKLRDITTCKTFEEYLEMSGSFLNLSVLPAAQLAGDVLARRLNRKHLHLPFSYGEEELLRNAARLADALGIPAPDFAELRENAGAALKSLRARLGGTAVEIDYTATPRPLGLARLLTEYGFHVTRVYADAFTEEERADFHALQRLAPDLLLTATLHPGMRFAARDGSGESPVLAIGQKAAYFSGTKHFVNMIEGGGMYGFDGIVRLCAGIADAFEHEKDTMKIIQYKALGCESCL